MTAKELQRWKVIENAVAGHITVEEASGLVKLSQVDWVRHGNRRRPKPWRIPEAVVEVEQVAVSRETVRRVLRGAGLASRQKRRVLEELGVEQIAALSPQAKG